MMSWSPLFLHSDRSICCRWNFACDAHARLLKRSGFPYRWQWMVAGNRASGQRPREIMESRIGLSMLLAGDIRTW